MLQNTLQQGLTLDAKVRYIFVEASDIAETARKRHNLDPISTRYCAESIAASLLLASQIKGDERITVQIVSETPKCSVLCDINAQGAIRAKISPPDMVTSIRQLQKESKLSEFRFQLHGYMVTIKHNKYQEIYRGITEIENQTITEALQHYFQQSAQIDCVMKIAVQQNTDGSIHAVTGILLERYPESLENPFATPEEFQEVYSTIHTMPDHQFMEQLQHQKLCAHPLFTLEKQDVFWQCSCSAEKIDAMLCSLGIRELESILAEEGQAEIICEFCSEKYSYNAKDLQNLLLSLKEKSN